jgi:hypothetical protein
MEHLETLKKIYELGYISLEEFQQRKTQIIDQLTSTSTKKRFVIHPYGCLS